MDVFEEYAPRIKDQYVNGALTDSELEAALDYLARTSDGPREIRETLSARHGLDQMDLLPESLMDATAVYL